MKHRNDKDEEWFRKRFPDLEARRRADEAADRLDVHQPMSAFIDVWIAAYEQVAGKKWQSP